MIFNLSSGGSGDNPLNVKISSGSELPSTGSTNEVYVVTVAAVTKWVMSAEIPSSPESGMVWFQTALSGSAELDILKQNSLLLALTNCKQYINDEWINCDAYLWSGTAWIQFGQEITILYEATGDDMTSLASSWTGEGWTQGGYGACPGGTISSTTLAVSSSYSASGQLSDCVVGLSSPIDMTGIKTISFTASVTGSAYGVGAALSQSKSLTSLTQSTTIKETGAATYMLDVSDLTDSYYIIFWGYRSSVNGAGTLNVTKVWYEADSASEGSESDTGTKTSGDGTEERETTGTFWDEIKYFTKSDFACSCGGAYCDGYNSVEPAEQTVRVVDEIRRRAGSAITITSAIRCPTRNAAVGGVSNSLHITGQAVDISSGTLYPYELQNIANEVMADLLPSTQGGIGKYSWGIHVDNGTKRTWEG